MILESVIFFALLLATTLIVAVLPRTMTAHAWAAIPFCVLALAAASVAFVPIERGNGSPGHTKAAGTGGVSRGLVKVELRWNGV